MTMHTSWLLDSGQTRQDTRLSPLGAFTPASPLATRSGVLPGSADGATRLAGFNASGSGMTVTVFPGRAVVQTSDLQGAYPVALTDQATLTVTDGDQQPRIDLIVLHVYDNLFDASGRDQAVLEIVKGTPAATPQPPAAPAGAMVLYQIAVPAGASAGTGGIPWTTALTGMRTATVAVGGILPVTTDTTPGAYPGQYRDVGGALQRWDGTAWQPYPPVPAWQSWTPSWSTTSGNALPSLGNATVKCRYVKIGPLVQAKIDIAFGSTTSFGTGTVYADNWKFGLPVPAAGSLACAGFAELSANSSTVICVARILLWDGASLGFQISTGLESGAAPTNSGDVDSITPWTWAASHTIRGSFSYEAAA